MLNVGFELRIFSDDDNEMHLNTIIIKIMIPRSKALLLLRHCATFCKLVHLSCSTPPALVSEGLALFDAEVRRHFCDCVAIDPSDSVWLQVQLSLSRGGLGLHRLALHCSAAYLASVNKAGYSAPLDEFTLQAVTLFNSLVRPASSISEESLLESCLSQKDLSSRIDDHQFDQLYLISTLANRARLLSVASCHASSWLAVIPTRDLNLSLDPDEFQVFFIFFSSLLIIVCSLIFIIIILYGKIIIIILNVERTQHHNR